MGLHLLSRELCPPLPWPMHGQQLEDFASACHLSLCCWCLLPASHKFVIPLKISMRRRGFGRSFTQLSFGLNFSPAIQGQAYASPLQVSGGLPPFRFWVAQGALPSGLSLNASTGVISGDPAVSGTFAFTIAVTDSRHGSGRQLLQFNVAPSAPPQISILLSPQSVQVAPGATVQFAAVVENTPQTAVLWSASAGSITPNGLFTAPAAAGTAVVTATAVASSAVRSSANVSVQSVQNASPLTIATMTLASAQVNVPYSASIIAQGGSLPYSWSLASGSLPSGLTLDPGTGVLSGSISQSGAFAFTAEVKDASGQTSARQLTLTSTSVTATNFDGPAELPRTTVQSTRRTLQHLEIRLMCRQGLISSPPSIARTAEILSSCRPGLHLPAALCCRRRVATTITGS